MYKALLHAACLTVVLSFSPFAMAAEPVSTGQSTSFAPQSPWRTLEPGFELAVFTPDKKAPHVSIVVLRLDPEKVDFVLLNSSRHGSAASLPEWASREHLSAAINASMYLPDAMTSTGYMRDREHINNPRIPSRFGAFFVASPSLLARDHQLPRAGILDRDADPWEERLPFYDIVAQNYRLISADGRMLWTTDGPSTAIAAVGQDKAGHILFIHCREPMSGSEFGAVLLALPLDLRTVMYVEGGSQAGLLVRAGGVDEIWMGRHRADFFTSGIRHTLLPNIIGARPRAPATSARSASPVNHGTSPQPGPEPSQDRHSPREQHADGGEDTRSGTQPNAGQGSEQTTGPTR